MDVTRRDLLKTGLGVAALATLPPPLRSRFAGAPSAVPPIADPDVKELALRAVDAARRAGAAYADVRLTHTRQRTFDVRSETRQTHDQERMVVGVRAAVDGYWGFASGPVWTKDEMDRLGAEAVHQAKANTLGKSRTLVLASTPVVRDGHWEMPVAIDPFAVAPDEILDYLQSLSLFVTQFPDFHVTRQWCEFQVQEKAFASSEGSFCTQRLYRSQGDCRLQLGAPPLYTDGLDVLSPAGMGWELYRGQPLREHLRHLMDEMQREYRMPARWVEVGRFDAVCDPMTVATLVNGTLGPATELDRALGYEANASGTSYLNDPDSMLGTYQAAAPLVTLTANRTEPGGAATVQWDDEGVTPDDNPLIRDGVLTDFQTTRESATWLADRYAAKSLPVRSHGCAGAPSALEAPLQHAPNMQLVPGKGTDDFESLIAGMFKGVAIKRFTVDMDAQALNGYGIGRVFGVKAGKRVSRVNGAAVLFRSPDLWKGLAVLGGAASARRFGVSTSKGQPVQSMVHSVTAPAALFNQVTIMATRK